MRKLLLLSRKDCYWVEACVAKEGLIRRAKIPEEKIRVIPNTYSDIFHGGTSRVPIAETSRKIVFTLAHPYPHKNLCIIPEVAAVFRKIKRQDLLFLVSLPESGREVRRFWSNAQRLGVAANIQNVGVLKLDECPAWYERSHVVFLPTLLETFSAIYPEAMAMGRPIVTTNLDFAHDICADAAEYFEPLSAESAARAILRVVDDENRWQALVENGIHRLKDFPSTEDKFRMQVEAICWTAGRG